MFLMLPAIEFDNQIRFMADEIDDITSNRFLPLEFQGQKAMRAQVMPQPLFGIGLPGSQDLGAFQQVPFPLSSPSPASGRGERMAPAFVNHVFSYPTKPIYTCRNASTITILEARFAGHQAEMIATTIRPITLPAIRPVSPHTRVLTG